MENRFDIACQIFKRYLLGGTYKVLAAEFKMPEARARILSEELVNLIRSRIPEDAFKAMYNQERYPHLYRQFGRGGQTFYAGCMSVYDYRSQLAFWEQHVDAVRAEYGAVDRPLVREDAMSRLCLPSRVYNCLRAESLRTVGEVIDAMADPKVHRHIPNFGQESRAQVLTALKHHGFSAFAPAIGRDILQKAAEILRNPGNYTEEDRQDAANQLLDYMSNRRKTG